MKEVSDISPDVEVEPEARSGSWSGVLAMSLGAFALIASEFMPVSLFDPDCS